jgi:hypothetical protein
MSSQSGMSAPIAGTSTSTNTALRHRAKVTWADGMLQVRADNSSLNQILRDISRETGMRIVGGVSDQRVFGSYGPAPAGTVLQTLLDGTGTNVLLQERPDHAPEQLVLTPQTGGGAPPPPSSPSYDATEAEPDLPLPGSALTPRPSTNTTLSAPAATAPAASAPATATPSTPPSMPQPANNVLGSPNNVSPTGSTMPVTNSVPVSSLPTPSTAPPVSGIVDAPNPPPAGSTTAGFASQATDNNPNTAPPATAGNTAQPAANAVKTPQQIYEELKTLQDQQKQQGNPPGTAAPK